MTKDAFILHEYELIAGLEIHVQLNTKSKLFSTAANQFGGEPNTNISEVCTGQPGALPVLNKEAVKKAVLLGCALDGHISTYSRFDRKSYFYPDSPRNFQITQFEMPIIRGGCLIADVAGKSIAFPINRAHLEDDAGMLKHFPNFAGVDYNRAGAPLIEIVSEPCMFSIEEAVAYAVGMKALLQYLDVSDCNMEEGSFRIDANISVRPKGEKKLRNKIEVKNLNSFAFLAQALESEFKRQSLLYAKNPDIAPEKLLLPATYRWDVEQKKTVLMRTKESAEDYRYFLEPDLPPLILEQEYIDMIKESLPELPYKREKRYIENYLLAPDIASIIVNDKSIADFFEEALKNTPHAKTLSNWIVGEFFGKLKSIGKNLVTAKISPHNVGQLINFIESGAITGPIAKKIAEIMIASPEKSCAQIIQENPDFQPIHDEKELLKIIDIVLSEEIQSVEDFKKGVNKAFGYLVGQVMKKSQGKASPLLVNKLLKERLK